MKKNSETNFLKNFFVLWAMFLLLFGLTCILLLTGCGHNACLAFKGQMTNIGYDPEFNKFGIQYYNGVFISGLNKEKTKTTLEYFDEAEINTGKTTTTMTFMHQTGNQTTGYVVDLAEIEAKK